MKSNRKKARLAGGLYLLLVILGVTSLMVIPSKLYVWDNPAATVARIQSHELLFRLGIACGLLTFLCYLILPLALYSLLSPVHKIAAIFMVALAAASVPITFMDMGHLFSVLRLTSGAAYLDVFDPQLLHSEVMLHLHAFNDGNLIAQVFWGLWLFPLGFLVSRSGFLPKILGWILMVGSIGYTFDCFGRVLWETYPDMILADYITVPANIGEFGICLWLLIMGAKEAPTAQYDPILP